MNFCLYGDEYVNAMCQIISLKSYNNLFGDSRVEIGRLSCRWKNEINLYFKQVPSWKEASEFLKKKFKNSSYRNFFS